MKARYYISDGIKEKLVSKSHYDKIKSFDDNTKGFFLYCNDLDLNKSYPIQGFDGKIKGIDLLAILNIMNDIKSKATLQLKFTGLSDKLYFCNTNGIKIF